MRPNSGLEPGREHDRPAGPGGHARAHEHQVRHVDGGQFLLDDRIGGLADRVRLTGEGDVVGRELVLPYQTSVRTDAVALLEHDDVAGDEVGGGDYGDVSVADDLGVRRHELLQRLVLLLGAVLLEETDGRVEQHDCQDRDRDVDVVLPACAVESMAAIKTRTAATSSMIANRLVSWSKNL